MPHHSTFSKNSHDRFRDSDLLRQVFETTVKACIAAGPFGGERFAVDATLIEADAGRRNMVGPDEWDPAAVDPDAAPRAVREHLAVLDDAAFGAASDAQPKRVAPSDPAAQWTGAGGGHATFAYAASYLIDIDHGILVVAVATRAIRQAETGAVRTMIDRTMDRFGLYPDRLIADTAYGAAPMLNWLVEGEEDQATIQWIVVPTNGIEPHIPVFDKSARRDGTFERSDFTYDHRSDTYTC
ncbi:hypothetical protein SAMN05444370_1373 [Rubrimonas cliftonensis]|uniref:Transposase DDE domain-containing protein n=1 Tax=Rubrimonas cliftonensis TaxID=89524 RepID=A0A1H4G5R5_9RHOB|nr:hypothetical protein SAMN05444370_1373 [Rubrimonas cliftonensis]